MAYQDNWPKVLATEYHRHEVGESAAGCANCILQEAAQEMSDFERGSWSWYCENVSPFAMEAGLVGNLFMQIAWTHGAAVRKLFLRVLTKIHQAFDMIRYEKMQQEARRTHG